MPREKKKLSASLDLVGNRISLAVVLGLLAAAGTNLPIGVLVGIGVYVVATMYVNQRRNDV